MQKIVKDISSHSKGKIKQKKEETHYIILMSFTMPEKLLLFCLNNLQEMHLRLGIKQLKKLKEKE